MTTKPRNTLAERALDPTPSALALYVHIPFCDTKCPYCDFNTYAGIEALMPTYVSALAHEIAGWGTVLEKPALGSVFFGGVDGCVSLVLPPLLAVVVVVADASSFFFFFFC